MTTVTRLLTIADLDDGGGGRVSVSARHEAELADGRRVVLLDDRGWASTQRWAAASADEIRETTRTVVGPDEPGDDQSEEDAVAGHWAYLAGILRRQGVVADAAELRGLPHDVLLSPRLLDRLGGTAG